jgi:hypothetical protein
MWFLRSNYALFAWYAIFAWLCFQGFAAAPKPRTIPSVIAAIAAVLSLSNPLTVSRYEASDFFSTVSTPNWGDTPNAVRENLEPSGAVMDIVVHPVKARATINHLISVPPERVVTAV